MIFGEKISIKQILVQKNVGPQKIGSVTVRCSYASKNELIEMSDSNITACMQSVEIDLYQGILLLVTSAGCNCGKDSRPIFESRVLNSLT